MAAHIKTDVRLPAEIMVLVARDAKFESTTVSAVLRRIVVDKYRVEIEAERSKAVSSQTTKE